jgi:hypothetical protein
LRIKSQKDFAAGISFSAVGLAFGIGAWSNYTVGDAARMGPGYFPLLLGLALAALGVAIVFGSLVVDSQDDERIGAIAWRPLGYIIGANLAFGALLGGLPRLGIPPMGLIIAIYGLVLIASLAGDEFKLKEVIVLATLLAVGSYVAFVWGLRLQFPVWPTFIAG